MVRRGGFLKRTSKSFRFRICVTFLLHKAISFVIFQKKWGLKTKGYFFLILFIAFLATPTVVACFDQDTDAQISFVEEENTNDGKLEFEKDFEIYGKDLMNCAFIRSNNSPKILDGYSSIMMDVYFKPTAPPPRIG